MKVSPISVTFYLNIQKYTMTKKIKENTISNLSQSPFPLTWYSIPIAQSGANSTIGELEVSNLNVWWQRPVSPVYSVYRFAISPHVTSGFIPVEQLSNFPFLSLCLSNWTTAVFCYKLPTTFKHQLKLLDISRNANNGYYFVIRWLGMPPWVWCDTAM